MRIAHLSDLHFGRSASPAKIQALREDLQRMQAELMVITGDITDRGFTSQFRRALEFLRSVRIPFVSVPGNREVSFTTIWEWVLPHLAMSRYSRYFGAKDRTVHVMPEHKIVLFGLNSVHWLPSWPGRLSRHTRYWFREQAAAYRGYFKGLFLHHPVLPVVRGSCFWAHSFTDAGEVLNICSENGICLILQGHKHRSAVMELSLPERNSKLIVAAGGSPLMPYWDSSYHIIDIGGPRITIQTREFLAGEFTLKSEHQFILDGLALSMDWETSNLDRPFDRSEEKAAP